MYIFLILKVRVQSLNVMEILFCHLLFSSGVGFVDKKNRKYLYISLLAFERPTKNFVSPYPSYMTDKAYLLHLHFYEQQNQLPVSFFCIQQLYFLATLKIKIVSQRSKLVTSK